MTTNDDEFRLSKIILENYRQYYGKVVANFSTEPSSFSIFLGRNGEGKSNLLNAIYWCLFRKEPHKNEQSLPVINTKYLNELSLQNRGEMRVTIYLQQGDIKYKISRSLVGTKEHDFTEEEIEGERFYSINRVSDPVPKGFEIHENMCRVSFQQSKLGGTWKEMADDYPFGNLVERILPQSLAEFFLLDGEFLEKLSTKYENVEDGIKQISQISLLKSTLDNIRQNRFPKQGHDAKVDEFNEQLTKFQYKLDSMDDNGRLVQTKELMWGYDDKYYHNSGYPRLKDLKASVQSIENKLKEINTQIQNSNASTNAELASKKNLLVEQKNTAKQTIDEKRKDYLEKLITVGPQIMCKNIIKSTNQLIENEITKGSLPNHAKITFTEDLLSKKICLCGTHLDIGTSARKNVETIRDQVTDDADLDIANEMRYSNSEFLKKFDKHITDMDKLLQTISDEKGKHKRLDYKIIDVERKLACASDIDYQGLIDNRDQLNRKRDELMIKQGHEEKYIKEIEFMMKEKHHQLTNLERRNEKAKKQIHLTKISYDIGNILKTVYEQISSDVREKVQKETTNLFNKISWKNRSNDTVVINSNYQLLVHRKDNYHGSASLSAGEQLFLALSFIIALRIITGYKFPLIIDTPIGKVSGSARILLAKNLPNFLSNSQLTLLATDTEYLEPIVAMEDDSMETHKSFKGILNEQIKTKESRIKFDNTTFCSSIESINVGIK